MQLISIEKTLQPDRTAVGSLVRNKKYCEQRQVDCFKKLSNAIESDGNEDIISYILNISSTYLIFIICPTP